MQLFLRNNKIILIIIALVILLIPAFVGIFHPGFFLTDDGNWMIIRLSAFYEALRQGQFPVRFLPRLNNAYGYPVADFLYPLFLYIGSFIHIFHISFVITIKILFAISLLASAVGSFFWLKKVFNTASAFIGALVYTLFPYHIWDITKRGSLGEVLAMGIAPFIFWQIEEGNMLLSGVGIGLLILAHNTLALLFLLVICGYCAISRKIKSGVIAIFIGLGLSTFFWLPALLDLQYTVFNQKAVADFSQYFLSNQLYPLMGISSIIVILLASSLRKTKKNFSYFFAVTLLSIMLTTKLSFVFWQIFHLGNIVQFPFRFLSLTALGVGFLAAFAIYNWERKYKNLMIGILIAVIFVSTWQFFISKSYQQYPATFYSTNQDSTTVQNEYMPVWVKQLPTSRPQKIQLSSGIITNISDKGSVIAFNTNSSQSVKLIITTVYFPGWNIWVDNKNTKINPDKISGFITSSIPQGQHMVMAKFTETPVRLFADIISLIAFITVLALIFARVIRLKRKV